jgi:hypothetical protein
VEAKLASLSEQEQNALILRGVAESGSFAEYSILIDENYQLEWFHEIIADKLEAGLHKLEQGENVRLAIFMPPRNGKSDMGTQKFPSYVLGKHPDWPIMVSSYSDELATDFGFKTRDIMGTPEYHTMFDTRLRHDAKAKGRWFTDKGGSYTAIGVGGSATGRGFKIGIIDDPFKNREEADSATIRDSRHKWYQSTFYTRAEGASMIILILTRWHEDDLAGRVLADAEDARKRGDPYDEWDVVEFKAIATQEDEHRKVGDPLWPAKFSLDQLQRIKSSIGSYEFSALYQQTPIDEENRKFKQAWFQYRAYEDVRQRQTYNTMTIDPRGKDDIKLGKDYIGVTINLCDAEGNWNIISERIKLSATGMIDMMFTNWARYKLRCIGVEDTQFWQGLKNQVDQEMKLRGVFPRIEELKTRGTQKELRIETLVPRYEHGNIYHLTIGGQNMCGDLEEELALFPKATNDDASDSLAYQDQVARKPMQEVGETFTSNNVGEYFL